MAETRPRRGSGGLGLLGLFFIAALVLVALFYVEQNFRGASDLAAAKARWKAAGYSLTASDYYPPSVPDDQNLAALPIFRLEPDPLNPGQLGCVQLRDATDEDQHGGELTEHKQELAALVAKAYAKMFPGKTPPASHLAQLEELYPLIVDLRTAARTRPIFRLNQDYAHKPAWDRPLGPVTVQIKVAKLLFYDAQLAVAEKQPQVAVDDFKVAFEVARGTGTDPSLVGGLITLGICAITRTTIDDGLSQHHWTDAQLAAIQDELKRIDCLSLYQFDMRSEVAAHTLPMYEWSKKQPSVMSLILGMAGGGISKPRPDLGAWLLWHFWASGWWDMNAAQTANLMLDAAQAADPKACLVDPKRAGRLETEVEKTKKHPRPWNILYAVASGSMTNAVKNFARMQAKLDEDRIVCGLERYRLAHGAYPLKLDVLAPASIDELPHDIINGAPYHYRLNANGTFVLYSVGWNQTDDGGAVALTTLTGYTTAWIDLDKGDWVWPMVPQ